jgi:hypothetical protein
MKPFRIGLLVAVAGAVCLFGCSRKTLTFKADSLAGIKNPSIHILADRALPATVSGTFGWGLCLFRLEHHPELNLSAIDLRLRNALQAELTRKGLSFSEKEPDVLVSYALAAGSEITEAELNRAYGGSLVMPAADPETALYYKRGVLILDLVDRKAKHLLWRGAIMADFDMSWPEERKQERCDAAVGELLRHYPKP